MISTPGFLPAKYYFEAKGHSITMILVNVALIIKQVSNDPVLDNQIDSAISDIKNYFIHPEFHTILETVGPNGEFIDTCIGRTINPGHCMETGWFVLDVARHRGNDPELVKMGTQIIDWAWEWGWDNEFGGMINFKDCKGFPPQNSGGLNVKLSWHHFTLSTQRTTRNILKCTSSLLTGHSRNSRIGSTVNGMAIFTGTAR